MDSQKKQSRLALDYTGARSGIERLRKAPMKRFKVITAIYWLGVTVIMVGAVLLESIGLEVGYSQLDFLPGVSSAARQSVHSGAVTLFLLGVLCLTAILCIASFFIFNDQSAGQFKSVGDKILVVILAGSFFALSLLILLTELHSAGRAASFTGSLFTIGTQSVPGALFVFGFFYGYLQLLTFIALRVLVSVPVKSPAF
jgi:hypothetical protein